LLKLERQLLAFVQRVHAGALDGRDVHEHIVAAVIRLDEAVALGRVEPLHGSSRHFANSNSSKFKYRRRLRRGVSSLVGVAENYRAVAAETKAHRTEIDAALLP